MDRGEWVKEGGEESFDKRLIDALDLIILAIRSYLYYRRYLFVLNVRRGEVAPCHCSLIVIVNVFVVMHL